MNISEKCPDNVYIYIYHDTRACDYNMILCQSHCQTVFTVILEGNKIKILYWVTFEC